MIQNNEFEIVVDFMSVIQADKAWENWLKKHDIKNIDRKDIVVDTGLGEFEGKKCDIHRYKIKTSKLNSIIKEK